jgi:hypothetical protein
VKVELPVSFLACRVPNLQFDAGAMLSGDYFSCILHTDGGVPTLAKLILRIFEQNVALPHTRSSDENQLKHEIELFLFVHFWQDDN